MARLSPDGPMTVKVDVTDGEIVIDLAHDPMVCVLLVTGKNEENEKRDVALTLSTVELARISAAFTQATAKAIRLDTEAWDLKEKWHEEEAAGAKKSIEINLGYVTVDEALSIVDNVRRRLQRPK